jgi:hypothetical protein
LGCIRLYHQSRTYQTNDLREIQVDKKPPLIVDHWTDIPEFYTDRDAAAAAMDRKEREEASAKYRQLPWWIRFKSWFSTPTGM